MQLIKLQHLLLPVPEICDRTEMYYREANAAGKVHPMTGEAALSFERDGKAEFDTYFNGFSIEKWKKYTQAQKISLTLRLQGAY